MEEFDDRMQTILWLFSNTTIRVMLAEARRNVTDEAETIHAVHVLEEELHKRQAMNTPQAEIFLKIVSAIREDRMNPRCPQPYTIAWLMDAKREWRDECLFIEFTDGSTVVLNKDWQVVVP